MVAWSTMFVVDGSASSSSSECYMRHSQRPGPVQDALKCYVCDGFYQKPRILPCGHTFCSDCLLKLRQRAVEEFNKSRDRNAHRRGDCGFFTCPWPDCHYSMKIMNVGRWSLRNKAAASAVAMVKKHEKDKQDSPSQTDIGMSSFLLTLPKLLFRQTHRSPEEPPPSENGEVVPDEQHTDCTDGDYFQTRNENNNTRAWMSFATKAGIAVMEQLFRY